MQLLNGVKNTLQFINDNWTTIVVIAGLGIGAYKKAKSYIDKSNEEKTELAWESVKTVILGIVADAELNYAEWNKAGSVKRAKVIDKIFTDYPILNIVTSKESVIEKIDELIAESLETIKNMVDKE